MRKTRANKKWEIAPRAPAEQIARLPDVDPLIVQLLYNRQVTDPAQVRAFLSSEPPPTNNPYLLKDLDRAVARIIRAIEDDELIAVYGDFDVDGITSAALLTEVITALGGQVVPYIPNRVEEGYGLNCQALQNLRSDGVALIVTVDCGTGAEREVEFARNVGLDVVVTDHHQVTASIPRACAVVNPRQSDCPYPFKDLAGVGVAFKVAEGLLQNRQPIDGGGGSGTARTSAEVQASLLDLVALGTIADVAPLLGENRTLVRQGLQALNQTDRPGLQEMVLRAGLRLGAITPTTVGYVLAPRLNSAGRLADALASYHLLTTKSLQEARTLAEYLEETNAERQRLTTEALAKAREEITLGGEEASLFLIAGAEYPAGVVGLVAGKLMEELYRPVLVVELGEEESRGSARSIAELNITRALASCQDLLRRFGGHAQAAGFTIPNTNLEEFKQRLEDIVKTELSGLDLQPKLLIDCELPLQKLSWDVYRLISLLAPFGFGNPHPAFLSRRVRVLECRLVGRDLPKHLRLKLYDGKRQWTALAFNKGDEAEALTPYIDVVYTLEPSEWNGTVSLDLHIKDWRPYEFP